MLRKVPNIQQPFRDYGEVYPACFVNYDGGCIPQIAEGVLISGLVDCIYQITIERNVFTGHDIMLLTGSHDIEKFGEERKVSSGGGGPITVREGAWIGTRAIILGKPDGTVIGQHAVIGAGAVVTKNVPDFEMWAGNPAKCIKRYNHEEKRWERVK